MTAQPPRRIFPGPAAGAKLTGQLPFAEETPQQAARLLSRDKKAALRLSEEETKKGWLPRGAILFLYSTIFTLNKNCAVRVLFLILSSFSMMGGIAADVPRFSFIVGQYVQGRKYK